MARKRHRRSRGLSGGGQDHLDTTNHLASRISTSLRMVENTRGGCDVRYNLMQRLSSDLGAYYSAQEWVPEAAKSGTKAEYAGLKEDFQEADSRFKKDCLRKFNDKR